MSPFLTLNVTLTLLHFTQQKRKEKVRLLIIKKTEKEKKNGSREDVLGQ